MKSPAATVVIDRFAVGDVMRGTLTYDESKSLTAFANPPTEHDARGAITNMSFDLAGYAIDLLGTPPASNEGNWTYFIDNPAGQGRDGMQFVATGVDNVPRTGQVVGAMLEGYVLSTVSVAYWDSSGTAYSSRNSPVLPSSFNTGLFDESVYEPDRRAPWYGGLVFQPSGSDVDMAEAWIRVEVVFSTAPPVPEAASGVVWPAWRWPAEWSDVVGRLECPCAL